MQLQDCACINSRHVKTKRKNKKTKLVQFILSYTCIKTKENTSKMLFFVLALKEMLT